MNKLTEIESGFGANAMAEEQQTERDEKLDDAMDNLVAIMSSDKGQAETLIATNAELVTINKAKDATITSLVAQNTNLMMIITKMSGGKTPTMDDLAGANGGGGHINQHSQAQEPRRYAV